MGGLFGSLASGLRRRELKTTDAGNLSWAALFGQPNARSGVSVNVDSALKVSTVFACLRVLADGIAEVPLKVYREKADGSKELAKDHPAYRLLSPQGTLAHGGSRLMAWAVGNARVEPRGNAIAITKQASGTAKIDPLMAAFNAVALMAMNPKAKGRSYLGSSDLMVL